jgi:hypothetical protein
MIPSKLAKSMGAGLVLGIVVLLSACQPSMKQVVAEHRPAVEAVFAKVKALEGAVRDTPAVTEDKVDVGGARVVLDGENENALFIRAADLAAPESASSEGNGALHANRVQVCGEALREDDPDSLPKGIPLYLEECERAEYVFVLRPTVDEAATLIDDATFQPGRFEGDVLLFRLADGALLGGFAVSEKSSEEVTVATDEAGASVDAVGRLNSDLSSRVFVAINEKLRANVPGVLPPL